MQVIEETESQIKVRLHSIGMFKADTFRTKKLGKGVSIIIAKNRVTDKFQVQAYRFDKENWTMVKVREFLKEHNIQHS